MSTSDPKNGIGRVYRYDGGTNWTLIGDNMGDQVSSLVVYKGNLYAGTSWGAGARKLLRYNCTSLSWTPVVDCDIDCPSWSGFRAAYVWPEDAKLYLGDIGWDKIGHYDGTKFEQVFPVPDSYIGSCIYDFESYDGDLYASAYLGKLWSSPDGTASSWTGVIGLEDGNRWELEMFQNYLYMGMASGQLQRFNGTIKQTIWTAPDGIVSMLSDGSHLFIGIGGEAGAFYGSETAGAGKIYYYDGDVVTPSSGILGKGIQVLYSPINIENPVWQDEVDRMVVPYDEVKLEFLIRQSYVDSFELSFLSNNELIKSFSRNKITNFNRASPYSFENNVYLAGVENQKVMDEIVDPAASKSLILGNSIKIIAKYTLSGKSIEQIFTVTPVGDEGEPLKVVYPDFINRSSLIPDPPTSIDDYYQKGDPGYSNIDNKLVRKYALLAATYASSPFPDLLDIVVDNVYSYVEDLLEPDDFPNPLYSDREILQWVEEGQLAIGKPYLPRGKSGYICVEHAYQFTSFLRALGIPARELNVGYGESLERDIWGNIHVHYSQEAAAEVWYSGNWHFYDPFIYIRGGPTETPKEQHDRYLDIFFAYKSWYAYDPHGARDWAICPSGEPVTPVIEEWRWWWRRSTHWKHRFTGARNGIAASALSPIRLLILDREGRRTGFTSEGIVIEIPGSLYTPQDLKGALDHSDLSSEIRLNETVFAPSSEHESAMYLLSVEGTSDGTYTILLAGIGEAAAIVNPVSITGSIMTGVIHWYKVEVGPNGEIVSTEPVNRPPVANAGPDQRVSEGRWAQLDGSKCSDPDGDPLSYQWEIVSGACWTRDLFSANTARTEFRATCEGDYKIRLTVDDGRGGTDSDEVTVAVRPSCLPPVAEAGDNREVTIGDTVQLDGSHSYDPNYRGSIVYLWEFIFKPEGSRATLSDPHAQKPSFVADRPGKYRVMLTATLNIGICGYGTDSVDIIANGPPPVGANIRLPQDVDRDGLFEDLNGNGRLDFDDAVTLALYIDTQPITAYPKFYDFNHNGRVDFDDAVRLAFKVGGQAAVQELLAIFGMTELKLTTVTAAPNPVTEVSSVRFTAQGQGITSIKLDIFDLSGRLVTSLSTIGQTLEWNLNSQGQVVANGVYLYVISARGFNGEVVRSQVRKLVVLR